MFFKKATLPHAEEVYLAQGAQIPLDSSPGFIFLKLVQAHGGETGLWPTMQFKISLFTCAAVTHGNLAKKIKQS